ncbi:MAG: TlpA family protein disulfide reductase [Caulobacteraceae bacterium]
MKAIPARFTPAARFLGVAALLYAIVACTKAPGELRPLARGAMAKLTVTDHPAPAPAIPFLDAAGRRHTIAEFRGRVVVVNIWANWCAPCKLEIPSLAKLQARYAAAPVKVVPVSVGQGEDETAGRGFIARNPPLVFYTEPTFRLAYAFSPTIQDMPTTILYDRRGRERARLVGGADWSGKDAAAVIDALLAEK